MLFFKTNKDKMTKKPEIKTITTISKLRKLVFLLQTMLHRNKELLPAIDIWNSYCLKCT